MNLIHFRGLNCYSNCLISIADFWKVAYADAFSSLWSEWDFGFAPLHRTHLTKRLVSNLEALGVSQVIYDPADIKGAEKDLHALTDGAFLIVGMDAFELPWSPVYQTLHNLHYFFARKEKAAPFSCFDPTYQKAGGQIPAGQIAAHAFELYLVYPTEPTLLQAGYRQEAEEIIASHPRTQEWLLSQIRACTRGNEENAYDWGKYIDTLLNNRLLFRHYLRISALPQQHAFDEPFFFRWEAVKNGLFKAAFLKDNDNVLADVCQLLTDLLQEEIAMAKQMLQAETAP